jgi:hypothetical protein
VEELVTVPWAESVEVDLKLAGRSVEVVVDLVVAMSWPPAEANLLYAVSTLAVVSVSLLAGEEETYWWQK